MSSSCVTGFREEVFPLYFYVSHGVRDNAGYIVGAQCRKSIGERAVSNSQVHKDIRQHEQEPTEPAGRDLLRLKLRGSPQLGYNCASAVFQIDERQA